MRATILSGAPVVLENGVNVNPKEGTQLPISGNISGHGDLTQADAGTLILNGVNSYSGNTVVRQGTMIIDNSQALPGNGLTIGADALSPGTAVVQLSNGIGTVALSSLTLS